MGRWTRRVIWTPVHADLTSARCQGASRARAPLPEGAARPAEKAQLGSTTQARRPLLA